MVLDASTAFVLALTVGIVILLAWAEMHSRRQQPSGGPTEQPTPPPTQAQARARRR
jgi:hypothetical protein